MSFARVWSLATLQMKLLVRSWRFWILSLLALLVSAILPAQVLGLHWWISGRSGTVAILHPSVIPTQAYQGISLVLGLAVVWFAFDAPFRHRKSRSEEILHSTPLSTAEMVVGQTVGILLPTSLVALFLSLAVLIIQWLMGSGLMVQSHVVHFFTQALPALAFTTAATLLLAVLTRSKAAAAVLGSATVVATLAVIAGWVTLDFSVMQMADTTGLWTIYFPSDMIGYPYFGLYLVQRFYVVLLTVCLLAVTVWLYPRLRGQKGAGPAPLVAAVSLVLAAGIAAWWIMDWKSDFAAAERAAAEQEPLADLPPTRVAHYDLDVDLTAGRDRLEATARMRLRNETEAPRSRWAFLLNSGLDIEEVEGAEAERGTTTLVLTTPEVPPGGETEVSVAYGGKLDDRGLFPGGLFESADLTSETRGNLAFMLGLMPYFVRDYAYLPAMARWYPVPDMDVGYTYPDRRPVNWATARLALDLPEGWTAATQGRRSLDEGERQVWESTVPVPQLAIYAGPYQVAEAEVAGVLVQLYVHPGHAGTLEFFRDAREEILRRAAERLERSQESTGLAYPYPQLNLVELAHPARAYTDGLDSFAAFHAPGIVALREAGLFTANLERSLRSMTGDTSVRVQVQVDGEGVGDVGEEPAEGAEESEAGESEEDGEAAQGEEADGAEAGAETRIAQGDPEPAEDEAGEEEPEEKEPPSPQELAAAKADMLESFFRFDFVGSSVPHAVIPSMWDYMVQPEGRLHPLLNRGLGGFVSQRATGQRRNFSVFALVDKNLQQTIGEVMQARFGGGMDWDEAAVRATVDMDEVYDWMTRVPLEEMDPVEEPRAYVDVVTVRGHAFFEALEQEVGSSAFAAALARLREQHAWSTYSMADLRRVMEEETGRDLEWLFSAWLEGTDLPGFRLLEVEAYRIASESPQPRYQVSVQLENPEPVNGYVTLELWLQGEEEPLAKTLQVPAGEAREWGVVVRAQPNRFRMSPILAWNRSPSTRRLRDYDYAPREPEEGHPFEGVREIAFVPWPDGIIVDDSDQGFRIDGDTQASILLKLRQYFRGQEEGELPGYNPWRGPRKAWARWSTERAYGRYNPTVSLVAGGSGSSSAVWEASLPEPGTYELMVYLPGRDLTRGMPQRMQDRNELGAEYVYRVVARDGEEEARLDPSRAETGWNSLGRFSFDAGTATVRLSDAVGDGMVWADAVRFLPVERGTRAALGKGER